MDNSNEPSKEIRKRAINDDYTDDDLIMFGLCNKKTKLKNGDSNDDDEMVKYEKFMNRKDDRIYVTGETVVHFTCGVSDDTIEKIKRKMSLIIQSKEDELVLRSKDEDDDENEDDSEYKTVTITYIVNSRGGSVSSVLSFVDFLRNVRATYKNIKFVSIITGLAASAGSTMCIAADERKMTKYAFAMIHETQIHLNQAHFGSTEFQEYANYIKKVDKTFVEIYLDNVGKYTKKNIKELQLRLLNTSWLSSNEYLEYGFVDEIL